ncbi:MFS transporter [Candidatus Peribacteria bacterium]|nr:MFS transporter [Candidatus Peribacteria bacterium]
MTFLGAVLALPVVIAFLVGLVLLLPILVVIALIGALLTAVFFAIRWFLTRDRGEDTSAPKEESRIMQSLKRIERGVQLSGSSQSKGERTSHAQSYGIEPANHASAFRIDDPDAASDPRKSSLASHLKKNVQTVSSSSTGTVTSLRERISDRWIRWRTSAQRRREAAGAGDRQGSRSQTRMRSMQLRMKASATSFISFLADPRSHVCADGSRGPRKLNRLRRIGRIRDGGDSLATESPLKTMRPIGWKTRDGVDATTHRT